MEGHWTPHTEEAKKKMSIAKKGKHYSSKTEFKKGFVPWNKGKKGVIKFPNRKSSPLSLEHRQKIAKGNTGRIGSWKGKGGDKSANWQGGIYPEHLRLRQTTEYKLWRQSVFIRDAFTCIWCFKKGGWSKEEQRQTILNADHIKPFCDYPELRFSIDNGRTLCKDCHIKTDTYGGRRKKIK